MSTPSKLFVQHIAHAQRVNTVAPDILIEIMMIASSAGTRP
jgi:hypothetical protein